MKRIARALYHRSPRSLKRIILGARGAIWRRQIPAFLNGRPPVPDRTRPVSVVIPSYNDIPILTKCLESLAATLRPDDEVIVVDDYCEPTNRTELLKLENQQTRVILKDERGGFAKTVNRGMAEAQFDIVLLNSDIVALPNWVEYLQEATDSSDNVGLVSAKLLYPDGRIQYGGTFWARSFAPQWFAHRFGGAKFDFAPSNARRFNWGAGGACMYVTRDAYKLLGGLDEEYWLGFEDVDYAMSAWSQGLTSVFEPNAVLFHHESATRGFHQGNRELGSMRTFWKKWRPLHDERNIDSDDVRIVLSSDEELLWAEYALAISHELKAPIVHPEDISGDFRGVSLVMSESALDTVWEAHVRVGVAIVIARDVPVKQSTRAAAFQPEFDYIVRNSGERSALESGIGWRALEEIAPFISATQISMETRNNCDLLVAFDANTTALKDQLIEAFPSASCATVPSQGSLVDVARENTPRVLINLCGWSDELEAIGVLATGCIVIAPEDVSLQWLLQNGLNCFTVPSDFAAFEERINGLSKHPQHGVDIAKNARLTLQRSRVNSVIRLENAIREAIAQRSISRNR